MNKYQPAANHDHLALRGVCRCGEIRAKDDLVCGRTDCPYTAFDRLPGNLQRVIIKEARAWLREAHRPLLGDHWYLVGTLDRVYDGGWPQFWLDNRVLVADALDAPEYINVLLRTRAVMSPGEAEAFDDEVKQALLDLALALSGQWLLDHLPRRPHSGPWFTSAEVETLLGHFTAWD